MSLIRQIWLLLFGAVLLVFAGSVAVTADAARDTLQAQLRLKNSDNAQSLALALSQQHGETELMQLLIAAQFDTGFYRRIRLVAADGSTRFEREAQAAPQHAPRWFVALLPVESVPGVAQVSDGWRDIGTLQVESHSAYTHDALWLGALRAAGWLAVIGAVAALAAAAGVRALRRPLQATVEQASALQEGRFVTVPLPRVPELRTVSAAMNVLVERLRQLFDAQARQVDDLRRQAELDELSGLSNRRQFIVLLDACLSGERATAAASLIVVRLRDLDGLNRRHGRQLADRALRTLALALAEYPARVAGGFAGRLNGSDFALYLPANGIAGETAVAVVDGLRSILPGMALEASVCAGSADIAGMPDASAALAAVDAALAAAEAEGAWGVVHQASQPQELPLASEAQWRQQIDAALAEGRVTLAEFAVVDRSGQTVQLDCPLRLQLGPTGAPLPAAAWLSHALRSRRAAALDLRALQLALQACTRDGRPRSINVALDSIATAGFVAEFRRALESAGAVARSIRLELPERALLECRELLRDAAREWSACGALVGIEHAGGASAELARLYELSISFVKIDRRHIEGVASDGGVRRFAGGLIALLRGMGLSVMAEGVRDSADLATLWDLGFDAVTGPAVTSPRG